jgi:hypothetical protein
MNHVHQQRRGEGGGGRLDDRDRQQRAGTVATREDRPVAREDRRRPRASSPQSTGEPAVATDVLSERERAGGGDRHPLL